jgi:ABC-type multidrug transport system fused ATPase/permease subunit
LFKRHASSILGRSRKTKIMIKDFFKNLSLIVSALTPERRKQLFFLNILMIVCAGLELFSLGAVIPFLAVLTQPDAVFQHPMLREYFVDFGFENSSKILLPVTIAFLMATLISTSARLFLNWAMIRVSFTAGKDISILIFDRVLHLPYLNLKSRNSSEIISALTTKTNLVVVQGIMPALLMVSGSITLISIATFFSILDPVIALSVFLIFSLFYIFIILTTKNRLIANSDAVAKHASTLVKIINEALGDSRDLILSNRFAPTIEKYITTETSLRLAMGDSRFISEFPRFVIEAFGIILITLLAYFLTVKGDSPTLIPVLGALALAAQRLLPIAQNIFNGWAQIRQGSQSLSDVVELLVAETSPDSREYCPQSTLILEDTIVLSDVSFRYPNTEEYVLKNTTLSLSKGSVVGFVGETGAGKSTLIDIIMGMTIPTFGSLKIDGVIINNGNRAYWRQSIAHVSQSIFLSDESILSFITSTDERSAVNYERVSEVSEVCQLTGVVDKLDLGFETVLGERGANFSGGQAQRFVIAKALYKNSKILVLDEGTSALDIETEKKLIESLREKYTDITIIMIAHRVASLKNCDRVFKVSLGKVEDYQL